MRESTQSGREVLLGMKQRGFTRPAKLAVDDGAMGFWSALSKVFPSTRTQRCWMHKTGNVLKKAVADPALDAEVDAHVEHEPALGNHRNGHNHIRVLTDEGAMEIKVPRDRAGHPWPVQELA